MANSPSLPVTSDCSCAETSGGLCASCQASAQSQANNYGVALNQGPSYIQQPATPDTNAYGVPFKRKGK